MLLRLGGRTLLDHVQSRFAPQCASVVLSANGDPSRFGETGLPVLPDSVAGQPGPLAGILAALDWAAFAMRGVKAVVSVTGDAPFLPSDFVLKLRGARATSGRAVACAASGGRLHPAHAVWPVACREALRAALLRGDGRVFRFASDQGLVSVEWPGEPDDAFANLNTPEDFTAAERRWARRSVP